AMPYMKQLNFNWCSGYKVEGNVFNNSTFGALGCLVYNSQHEPNQIYRNQYEGLYLANYAEGINSNNISNLPWSQNIPRGLEWLCNRYSNSIAMDQYVYVAPEDVQYSGYGVKRHQGSYSLSAGNIFSTGLTKPGPNQVPFYHYLNNDHENQRYYYDNQSNKKPLLNCCTIELLESETANTCLSSFSLHPQDKFPIFSQIRKNELQEDLNALIPQLVGKKTELEVLLEVHDAAELHLLVETVNQSNKLAVKSILLINSPYLSVELMKKLADKSPGVFPNAWLKEVLQSNIELVNDKELIEYLKNKANPFPQGILNQLLEEAKTRITEKGKKLQDIEVLVREQSTLIDQLMQHELSDTSQVDWQAHEDFLTWKESPYEKSLRADLYAGMGNKAQSSAWLDEIENDLPSITDSIVYRDLSEYLTYKRYMEDITNDQGAITQLTDEQVGELIQMKNTMKGKAGEQISNVLCFFKGICNYKEPTIIEMNKNGKQTMQEDEENANNIKIHPNPNNGSFILQSETELDLNKIHLFTLEGKEVECKITEIELNTYSIKLNSEVKGVYLLKTQSIDNSKQFLNKIFIY
ncbi:MAG: T9SS type A sorting domain-containing protein, partial [Flavobacteriia bacterium]|nr:T9SS type A sorting domain-containing protein [Flavobacteriia bacterium]